MLAVGCSDINILRRHLMNEGYLLVSITQAEYAIALTITLRNGAKNESRAILTLL